MLKVRYQPRGWDWPELLTKLKSLKYRAAIVGPEGSGKTTLVEDLAERLAQQGFRPRFALLNRQQRRLDHGLFDWLSCGAGPTDLLCLDGCEQLGPIAWRRLLRLCRRLGGLLITLHRPARLPTLVTCDTDAALLLEIASTLHADALTDRAAAEFLLRQHAGNIRTALRELYDQWWQRQLQIDPSSP